MRLKRLNRSKFSGLLGIVIICVVASGIYSILLTTPLNAGILPQSGDARYELAFWESIKNSDRPEDYEAYLKAFPKGRFVPLAEARVSYLRADSAKTDAPSPPKIEALEATYEAIRFSNLRAEPSVKSQVVGSIREGEKVQVTGRAVGKHWFRIKTDGGVTGFVYGDLIREYPAHATAANPVVVTPRPTAPGHRVVSKAPVTHRATRPRNIAVTHFKTFKDCPACPRMVRLPAGQFVMGDDRGDATETPAHRVSIDKPFAIGKHEVTVAEWNACTLGGGCNFSPVIAGADPVAPVRGVNWRDAIEYVSWLRSKTGRAYRLPTEAEWEYAARGGTNTRYWWGDRPVKGLANCKDCGGMYNFQSPTTTRSYAPNPFGLHEMSGGVWEWVRDCWHEYDSAPNNGGAWVEESCRQRVLRGGSWRGESNTIHSASRKKHEADVRYLANGFRVAISTDTDSISKPQPEPE